MQMKTILCREMFGRVSQFFAEHTLTMGARATALIATVNTINTEIDALGVNQAAGRGEYAGSTFERRDLASRLEGRLRDMCVAAEGFAPAEFPMALGIFQMPRSRSYTALLNTAGAFLAALTAEVKAAFVAREFPADFDAELTTLVADFEAATERQSGGLQRQAGGTHGLRDAVKRGRAAVRELNGAVRAKLRTTNPVLLEVWKRAARVESAPRSTTEATPATAPAAPAA